jgi:NAD(P)-dependent dehydrogenase (short-subunit alcohol dehydrogenase family)
MSNPLQADAVWLITGCSSGIGRILAENVLKRGYRVALTARNPATIADLQAQYPQRSVALALDVTKKEQVKQVVAQVEREFGAIDVLVNNAAYGYLAAIEEGEDDELRAMFETNFFGALETVKTVLPGMRARKQGHIINVSSQAGLVSMPGTGYYSSTKFALEAMTEALWREVKVFGIRVSAIEPGPFRTDWSGRSLRQTNTPLEAYADTVGARRAMVAAVDGKQPGDPQKAAEAIIQVAEMAEPPLHLLLGKVVLDTYRAKLADIAQNLAEWESVTLGADFPPEQR